VVRAQADARPAEEQEDADTGRIVWDGAVVLAKHLERASRGRGEFRAAETPPVAPPNAPPRHGSAGPAPARLALGGARVIELGAGTGLSGLAAAALGAAEVALTDLPYCTAQLAANAEASRARWAQTSTAAASTAAASTAAALAAPGRVRVAALDWTRPVESTAFGRYDVILGADVVWLKELVGPLARALEALTSAPGGNPDAVILLAHQTRSSATDELLFSTLARRFAWDPKGEPLDPEWSVPGKIRVLRLRRRRREGEL
jgi:predicted nicotinamide N-methyase